MKIHRVLIAIFLFCVSTNIYSQTVTRPELNAVIDSTLKTLDSTVIVPVKKTTPNVLTVNLDTLVLPVNTLAIFELLVMIDSDVSVKSVLLKNQNGIYSILDDADTKVFSHNRSKSIFSSTILYQISSTIINNKVIIQGKGRSNTTMNWWLSTTIRDARTL